MVHHVTFGAEGLPAVLGAVKRPVVVVHSHVDCQVVPVVKALSTVRDRANENCTRLVIGKVRLQILT